MAEVCGKIYTYPFVYMKISLSTERMVKEKKLTIVFYTRVCVHTNTAIYIYIYIYIKFPSDF